MEKLKDFVFGANIVSYGLCFCIGFLMIADAIMKTVINDALILQSFLISLSSVVITSVGNFFLQD